MTTIAKTMAQLQNCTTTAKSVAMWVFRSLAAFFVIVGAGAAEHCSVQVAAEPSECSGNLLLRLKPWYGRLGNNIVSLAHVLHLGRETRSEVIITPHPYFKQTEWDFREASRISAEVELTFIGTGNIGRQIAITDDFYHEVEMPLRLANWSFTTSKQRRVLVEQVLPAFRIVPRHVRDSIVIHVRAGDVFTHTVIHPYYGQPPFAFYKTVLQLPELAALQIFVVVEDYSNPVVALIEQEYKGRVQIITDLEQGVATILGSRHLVLARSTFSENLGKMAPSVQNLYFPYCVDEDGNDKRESKWDLTWNMKGYCYEYDHYIPLTAWTRSPQQMEMMSNFSSDRVHSFQLPVVLHDIAFYYDVWL